MKLLQTKNLQTYGQNHSLFCCNDGSTWKLCFFWQKTKAHKVETMLEAYMSHECLLSNTPELQPRWSRGILDHKHLAPVLSKTLWIALIERWPDPYVQSSDDSCSLTLLVDFDADPATYWAFIHPLKEILQEDKKTTCKIGQCHSIGVSLT